MNNRKLLMIPGPIEFEPAVLNVLNTPTPSHVAPKFVESFGSCLDKMLEVWKAPTGQPFIVAGSGTLAMDMAAANLTEAGDHVLVISSGYFGKRFQDIFDRYGAKTTIIEAEVGDVVSLDTIEAELKAGNYNLLSFTHVDTSTGVKTDAKAIAALAQKYKVLSILDGVCSVAGERIEQDDWGVDVVLTASQKAIGVPPGLALLVASQKAMAKWQNRKTPVSNYYADFVNWLPIMKAYQERRPSYFGTPPCNLILALEVSLNFILDEGMEARFTRHESLAKSFRKALRAMDFQLLAKNEKDAASTLSAVCYPLGVEGSAFLGEMGKAGIIVAGGLLPSHKTKYFRVGHMGAVNKADLLATLGAIESSLKILKPGFELGIGVRVFLEEMRSE